MLKLMSKWNSYYITIHILLCTIIHYMRFISSISISIIIIYLGTTTWENLISMSEKFLIWKAHNKWTKWPEMLIKYTYRNMYPKKNASATSGIRGDSRGLFFGEPNICTDLKGGGKKSTHAMARWHWLEWRLFQIVHT